MASEENNLEISCLSSLRTEVESELNGRICIVSLMKQEHYRTYIFRC